MIILVDSKLIYSLPSYTPWLGTTQISVSLCFSDLLFYWSTPSMFLGIYRITAGYSHISYIHATNKNVNVRYDHVFLMIHTTNKIHLYFLIISTHSLSTKSDKYEPMEVIFKCHCDQPSVVMTQVRSCDPDDGL